MAAPTGATKAVVPLRHWTRTASRFLPIARLAPLRDADDQDDLVRIISNASSRTL